MSTTPSTPADVLASEPERKQGIKTPYNQDGDRRITFRWTIGETTGLLSAPVTMVAVLVVYYSTDFGGGRSGSQFEASLWREERDGTFVMTTLVPDNGLPIHLEPVAHYSAERLPTLADEVLAKLRGMANDPRVLAYFTLSDPRVLSTTNPRR